MNPLLSRLNAYPFERLRELLADVTPNPAFFPISLGMGEPRHPTPALIKDALVKHLDGLAVYPATAGELALRQACAGWLQRRYKVVVNPQTQVLPVNGSREALFALTQTVVNPRQSDPVVLCPNPMYQIYEGATLLAGAEPVFVAADPTQRFLVDWDSVRPEVWAHTQMVFVCSPGNPTGAVMPLAHWQHLFELSDRYGFAIASDECYSEIYFADQAPLGGLQAAQQLGRGDFKRLMILTSLSKRSNVPGLRSGFVAGDADLIKAFLLYRTYHGSAMSPPVQAASIAAWSDETHVAANRALYQAKFESVIPLLASVMNVTQPDAGFYLWAQVPEDVFSGSDTEFVRALAVQYNVQLLPGSFLGRETNGYNPGQGRVRMALVADLESCVQAAERIVEFIRKNTVKNNTSAHV